MVLSHRSAMEFRPLRPCWCFLHNLLTLEQIGFNFHMSFQFKRQFSNELRDCYNTQGSQIVIFKYGSSSSHNVDAYESGIRFVQYSYVVMNAS